MIDANFCVMPWIHVHTYPNGKATPCCMWDMKEPVGDITQQTVNEIAHSTAMDNIRSKMINGEIVSGCFQCNEKSNSELKTINFRKKYNDEFSYLIPNILENTTLTGVLKKTFETKFMNIRYSNLCNYACRTCGPSHSSLWAQEKSISNPVKKIINIIPNYIQSTFEQLKTVDSINFAGGESILIPEHWEILDKLIELNKTDVRIRYVTNLSKLTHQNKNILEYAKKFPNFVLMASVDASHQRAELYRHGTDWDIVENNLKEVRNSKINFFINCTVGATNVWHVSDLQRYLIEQNIIESDNFHMNLLVDSKMMSIKILPNWFKKQIVQKIFLHKRWLSENRLANSNWDDIIKFMISEDHSELLPQYISYNRELDKIRNQQITKVFPELRKVFDN